MRDTEPLPPRDEPEDGIIVVQVKNHYWLLEGEEHLSGMLTGLTPYPTPVRCFKFASEIEFKLFMPECGPLAALWGINPLIIDRLRRDRHLVEIEPPV